MNLGGYGSGGGSGRSWGTYDQNILYGILKKLNKAQS